MKILMIGATDIAAIVPSNVTGNVVIILVTSRLVGLRRYAGAATCPVRGRGSRYPARPSPSTCLRQPSTEAFSTL